MQSNPSPHSVLAPFYTPNERQSHSPSRPPPQPTSRASTADQAKKSSKFDCRPNCDDKALSPLYSPPSTLSPEPTKPLPSRPLPQPTSRASTSDQTPSAPNPFLAVPSPPVRSRTAALFRSFPSPSLPLINRLIGCPFHRRPSNTLTLSPLSRRTHLLGRRRATPCRPLVAPTRLYTHRRFRLL